MIKHLSKLEGGNEVYCGAVVVDDTDAVVEWSETTCKACLHGYAKDLNAGLARQKAQIDAVNTRASQLQTYTG